ncbi:sialidase family protein [Planctomycetes bacterium K23_9]|uniref:exo-alpha-sialidase n=1 Tax=Stieleria marina TaxID=1930275 RepID=A0A517NQP5_9BACT|nr:hypothetical protein K239x_13900 [Planctomycetes bacterium K23_9]
MPVVLRTIAGCCVLLIATSAFSDNVTAQDSSHTELVLRLPPKPGNPRNSEGDFVGLQDDKILFVYSRFRGGSDHDAADLVSRLSSDGGATWSTTDELVVPNDGGMNVMSVSLLRLHDGRIALFYLLKNSLTDCRPVVRFSTDEAKTWSEPRLIPDKDDVGYFVVNNDRVVQLQSGRLIVPAALHHRPAWEKPDWRGEISCYISDDSGMTWRLGSPWQKGLNEKGERIMAQEPGVVELPDGRLMMFIRTNQGTQYQSFSSDQGDSWTPMTASNIASPQSPASIERIPGANDLLMIWNDHHDLPIEQRKLRTPLTLARSSDKAGTWQKLAVLRDDPDGWYCYTAMHFTKAHVLAGYIAGQQKKDLYLSATEIKRIPLAAFSKSTTANSAK